MEIPRSMDREELNGAVDSVSQTQEEVEMSGSEYVFFKGIGQRWTYLKKKLNRSDTHLPQNAAIRVKYHSFIGRYNTNPTIPTAKFTFALRWSPGTSSRSYQFYVYILYIFCVFLANPVLLSELYSDDWRFRFLSITWRVSASGPDDRHRRKSIHMRYIDHSTDHILHLRDLPFQTKVEVVHWIGARRTKFSIFSVGMLFFLYIRKGIPSQ